MKQTVLKEFQKIPGVGKSIAQDLWDLGIRSIDELKHCNAEFLYEELCKQRESHIDRCMLYVFRCAIYFASEPNPDSEKLKWWNWKDGVIS